MSYAVADRPVTIAEFVAFTEAQPHDTRWELLDGHILAMTNPTGDHGQIALSIAVGLRSVSRKSGCWVNVAGMRVQASDDFSGTTATIPDITVGCGPRVDGNWVTDPVVVAEVLSPSTMDYDRGPKLDFYKTLPTMQDILLVYQDQVRVEHYRREGDGWVMDPLTAPDAELKLRGLPFATPLSDIYVGTRLET